MGDTVYVRFLPLGASGAVPKGITILAAARLLGVQLEGPCNGAGTCQKDKVQCRTKAGLQTVLACQTGLEEDAEILVPAQEEGLQVVEGYYGTFPTEGPVPSGIVKGVTPEGTAVWRDGALLLTESGDTCAHQGGLALDLGTTTLAAALVESLTGRVLAQSAMLNPLVHYGHDVMSRIHYSQVHEDGLLRMHQELLQAIHLLLDSLTARTDLPPQHIYRVVAAGNPTLQHIFLNQPIVSIGHYPYTAPIMGVHTCAAATLGLAVCPHAQVQTFPCFSAHVGGDITAGLVAVGLTSQALPGLFIDIGTNGEMALLSPSGILATSCAAGPCFEGMSITHGMRAGRGAIERVRFEEGVSVDVIGGGAARGICGSGLLDAVSGLLQKGLVNGRGRLADKQGAAIPAAYRDRLFLDEAGKRAFRVTEGVSLSQGDIRQVQLARAAIRSGVDCLLETAGISCDAVKTVVIAGGFGYHLNQASLLRVGLLPDFPQATFAFVGNASLAGASLALRSVDTLAAAERLVACSRVIELATVEGFDKRFTHAMGFE